MKVLFTYHYGEEKMKFIEDMGYELLVVNENEISNTDEISDIDILVCYNPFEKLDISLLRRLKWIQLSSIGIDQLPKQKVRDQGIVVTNNKSGYSIPMGEWIVMNMLELLKNSKAFYKRQTQKKWQMDTSVLELYNKTVCFIGTGSIAQEAAKRLQGFDVKVIGINTSGREVEHFHRCFPMEELNQALAQSDIVVLSIPYTKETHHLINEKNIGFLKEDACLINIARGSIIEEGALVEALRKGSLRGAALDVFEEEPLREQSPLWEMENVIVTPHNSWVSEMRNERRYQIIYENLKRYAAGETLRNIVDIDKGY